MPATYAQRDVKHESPGPCRGPGSRAFRFWLPVAASVSRLGAGLVLLCPGARAVPDAGPLLEAMLVAVSGLPKKKGYLNFTPMFDHRGQSAT
jgi:hypothetical protein